jgi:hypothetical protein
MLRNYFFRKPYYLLVSISLLDSLFDFRLTQSNLQFPKIIFLVAEDLFLEYSSSMLIQSFSLYP